MLRPFLQVFVTLLSLALTSTPATQQSPVFTTRQDVSDFMQHYYLRPEPELIAGLVDALHPSGYLERENAISPLVAYFSEVFAANPDRLSQWQVRIQKQDEKTKAALERALSLSKGGGILKLEGHAAPLNDMYWGAFFASGNPDFIRKLIDQLHYVDERDDFSLFMTGVSAEWSLSSNAQSYILVRSTLETAKGNSDKRTQELIRELLDQGPARVKQEASEIIRKQREGGKWSYAPANTTPGRIQNIAPEEMWKRVTQCMLPKYPELAFDTHITGTVDIGLGISPDGAVDNARVLDGPPLLVQSALDAIRQWKFRPNVAQGEVTWSRVRALVRFNADGTTAVALAPAILADNFGDPGTPRSTVVAPFPRPESSPVCKSVQPWTGAERKEIEAGEVSPGLYKNSYFGLTFRFPKDWQVADRETLDSMDASRRKSGESQNSALPQNVQRTTLPSYLLFFARTDGPLSSSGPSVQIWAEKELFAPSAREYFSNSQFLNDKNADGTSGPKEIEIAGTKYYRGDRWGKLGGRSICQVRLVTYVRDLLVGIDVVGDTAATAEQLVKKLEGLTIISSY
jgi:TonB family protein